MDSAINANNDEQLKVEQNDHLCRLVFTEVDPFTRDTDSCDTTKCVGGDWSAEVDEENLAFVKQEPDDVCFVVFAMFILS